ncbi:MAG TPA: DNA-binding response regulator, partial [Rhodospirillaceae bacterium]|nr:DNA-binding response regulator [Rhodospirillaceae bacterium]
MHALIIDDHPVFQDALASVLKDLDMRIRIKTAASVAEALALIDRETPYRLVTLDLTMPGLDGFAFLRILQQRRIATSVVVVSAVEDPATMQACIAEGAKGFIPKSWRMDRMQAAVKRVLAGETFLPEEALTGPPAPGAEVQ